MKLSILMLVSILSLLYASCARAYDTGDLESWLASRSIPLNTPEDLNPLMLRIGDARIVLLGEASHGTSEYYSWRAEISKRLVAEQGFHCIAVEGDWPSCSRINSYVKHLPDAPATAEHALRAFQRWPRWMWANRETADFVEWIAAYNSGRRPEQRVGFHGLDLYSMNESMHAILDYSLQYAPEITEELEAVYGCLLPFGDDHQRYARHTLSGQDCAAQVKNGLSFLTENAERLRERDRKAFFGAWQNAHVVKFAERHYRAMADPNTDSWNVRVEHMKATLSRLLEYYGPEAKIIVWAHNTHIGDARATDMVDAGMKNIGWLARERFGAENVAAVGFATHRGTVLAGRQWGADVETMTVPPAMPGSIEHDLNAVEHDDFLLIFDEEEYPADLLLRRGHRAKGVVYNPESEQRNYVPSILPQRYDALIFISESSALTALNFDEAAPEHEVEPSGASGSGPSYQVETSVLNFSNASAQVPGCTFPPKPPAAQERIEERHTMVSRQIAAPRDGRETVRRPEVLAAMRTVPRHVMVPTALQRRAYDDSPLPIGHGQTISQPYIVAIMTELLELSAKDKVLEIGTGSGYQAAVLAHITPHVYSIEIIEPLYKRASRVLKAQGYDCVRLKHGDGYHGWPEHGPYDAIIVTCAAGHLPPPLWNQLKKGGRIVIPIGGTHEVQRLVVVTKQEDGSRTSRTIMPVRFVPLTRGG